MTRSDKVPLSRTRQHADDAYMDNPAVYVSGDTDAKAALTFARWIGKMCRDSDVPQRIDSVSPAKEDKPVVPDEGGKLTKEKGTDTDLEGQIADLSYDGDYSFTKPVSVTYKGTIALTDSWQSVYLEVCRRLFDVSFSQLYEYVRAEMQMFLNDNDMDDPRKVFDMAEHLFEKEGYHGKRYTFWMKTHISRSKESVTSNLDVIKKFARDHNGFFRYDELVDYLEQVGIKTGNLRGQMQLGYKPIFFYYSSEEILSAESMQIDEAWLEQAGKALGRLFADVGDHVVLRSINPIWYEQMPTLPGYLPWTPLLLQYILQFYGKKLGAKTIGSELNQKFDVLHAMLVTLDSEVQTFADAVVAHLVDNNISERQYEAEELRGKLVEGGLIAGNELIWHMPKAIGSDPRFAWDASGGKVSIKV